MKFKVTEPHISEFPNPIKLRQGERVILGIETVDWVGWIYCTKEDNSNAGWVPEQVIRRDADGGTVTEDYFADELTVAAGAELIGIKTLNHWLLARTDDGKIGWIPLEKLTPIGTYRHSKKGTTYKIIAIARHTETLEDLVVYQPIEGEDRPVWARPISMWNELVEHNDEMVPRFQEVNP